jgi:hypothetical protein
MSATKLLDATLLELEDTWGYTREELSDIQDKLLVFASTVAADPSLTQEVHKLAEGL